MMAMSSMDSEISHFKQGLRWVKLMEILERQVSEGSKRHRTYDFEVLDSSIARGVKKPPAR